MSCNTMKGHIIYGRIELEDELRDGKFVHKFISLHQMFEVVDKTHNWITLHAMAKKYHKHYEVLRKYADLCAFGPIGKNLSQKAAVNVSVLPKFEKLYQLAEEKSKKKQGSKKQYLEKDEICLLTATKWLNRSEGTLWRYYKKGYLPGRSFKKMVVVKIGDFKNFVIQVAKGEIPIDFELVKDATKCPELNSDKELIGQIIKAREEANNSIFSNLRKNQFSRTLIGNQLNTHNVAEILGAPSSTVHPWFQKRLISCRFDRGMYITTLPELKKFLIEVYAGKKGVKASSVEKGLEHPILKRDRRFLGKIRKLSELP